MAKNTDQVRNSFIIAGLTCFFLIMIIYWLSVLVISTHPDLPADEVGKYIIFDYSHIGLRGLTLAGVMTMVMSTADSYVNSTSILIVHDFCKTLKINWIKNELIFTRIVSLLIGAFAIILAFRGGSLVQLIIATNTFYMPIVTVPFIMSLFGFRSSGKSVLIGMISGLVTVFIWDFILQIKSLDALVPGMAANLLSLFASHYLLKQQGGWVGIKDNQSLEKVKNERKRKIRNLVSSAKNFNLNNFLQSNSPNNEAIYAFLGLFCIISIYCTMHTIPKEIQNLYPSIISVIYPSVLVLATILISYPLWLNVWKEKKVIAIFWNIAMFYILIFASFLFVVMSDFSQLQLMTFMINLVIIAVLVKWQWALIIISIGIGLSVSFFNYFIKIDDLSCNLSSVKFETAYILLLVSSIIVIFLRPKQEYQKLTEDKVGHLSDRLDYQEEELTKALDLKDEFIRNVSHEYHAPMTGVISTAETLWAAYEQLPDNMRKQAAENIYRSMIKLNHFDDNINSLAKLNNPKHELAKEYINLSQLLEDRVAECIRLYIADKDVGKRNFILNTDSNIYVQCDKYYITKTMDNLIINAISYCKNGNISVVLKAKEKDLGVVFEIKDEGIGIPKADMDNIFGAFVVGSKTRTPAGGRGVRLALCKKVIEMHGGNIEVESDGSKGAIFRFTLFI